MVDEPPFTRVGIVGLGLIGGSIALAARRRWPTLHITACDPAPVTREAVSQGILAGVVERAAELADCDLIVVATPVQDVAGVCRQLAEAGTGALVTDVAGTKRVVMEAVGHTGLLFVGGHPVAGSERSGLAAARADLFDARPWLLVSAGGGAIREAREAMLTTFVTALGARPSWTDAVTHDRVMAHVSHAPQLVSTALMAASGDAVGADGVAWSGQGFADMTRLAGSSSSVWQGILSTNADFIAEALTAIAQKLPTSSQALMDAPAVRDLFAQAQALKSR